MTTRPYVPPFQEGEPSAFWMLVGCILRNRTGGARAAEVTRVLKRHWPNPAMLMNARRHEIEDVLACLGLSRARGRSITELARVWVGHPRPRQATAAEVRTWPGCGPYAADSWAIFVEKRRDVAPTDRRLREFLAHAKGRAA